jgi:hypothetical protein
MNLCACGCGQEIIKKYNHYTPKYIQGHYIRTNNPMNKKEYVKNFKISIKKSKDIKSEKTKNSWKNPIIRKRRIDGLKKSWGEGSIRKKMKKAREKSKEKHKVNVKRAMNRTSVKQKLSLSKKFSIKDINEKYPFFSKIEEMRYNPDKPKEKEIQVHCKNHNCKNSKEKGGWFTPTRHKIFQRIRAIDIDGCNLYCSDNCKNTCPLFNLKNDPYEQPNEKPYTDYEYKIFRDFVLERDNYTCQYCEKPAEHVHHERPQKLEPFFALDPDLAWSCCEKCHYPKGHVEKCSTGNLATINCKGQ